MLSPSLLHSPRQNHLLGALPLADLQPLLQALELVPMPLGQALYEPGLRMRHAFFPTTAVVSLHYVTTTGASVETTGVGHEGVVGIALFMGGDTTSSSAMVQAAGHGYRLERSLMQSEFERAGALQRSLLRYALALIAQISQSAACYRHHNVEQQLCRWLLNTLNRLPGDELVLTHELVAHMLGVRRESITEAAGKLQDAGYIRYRRGHISVQDREGLQTRACECYGVVQREMQRLRQVPEPGA